MRHIFLTLLAVLFLSACGGAGRNSVDPVYPVDLDGPYADKLQLCARAFGQQVSCRLNQLPPIGLESDNPDVDLVMQRVATTHDWMGERFAELLEQMPPEILHLTRSLSAIIIGADVRPSFYWRHTGAIYLDPATIWLSVDEKRTIDPEPDYRSGFGNGLKFRVISRYVLDNDYAWYSYSLSDDSERELDDVLAPLARLLYHELAHAGDFFPPAVLKDLDASMTYAAAANWVGEQGRQISQNLDNTYPLQSEPMRALARVNFFGSEPSNAQLALQAPDVTGYFAPDIANDDYSYATRYEDMAMLFEELMMDYTFGIQRDVAVANRPPPGEPHVVDWGQRGRIGDDNIQPRVQQVAMGLLPETDLSAYFASQPAPRAMRAGATWNENLDPSGQSKRYGTGLLQRRELDLVLE